MNTRKWIASASACLLLGSGVVHAQSGMQHGAAPGSVTSGASHLVMGTVRSIDSRTLVVAHLAIESLGMGAMTMPFRLAEGLAAPAVKAGDSVAFVLTQGPQGLAVTPLKKIGAGAAEAPRKGPGMEHGMGPGMQQGMGDMMAMMDQCRQMMNRK